MRTDFQSLSTAKAYWRGTHRTRSPRETVELALAVAPLAGITRVANITGLDRIGIPVVSVVRPNARSISVAQGKGLDLECAKASGLMEAIEGYHAEHIALPLTHSTGREMAARGPVADISRIARVDPREVDVDQRMLWIEGRELHGGGAIWLPYEVVHTDFTDATLGVGPSFLMSSNGLASGNHLVEAWNHALYEVIERDATTLWELSAGVSPGDDPSRLDLTTVDEPSCVAVLERLDAVSIQVVVHEVTSDVGVPCYRCVLGEPAGESLHPRGPTTGYGCHADRSIALLRALLEAAQSRLTVIAGARDDITPRAYDAAAIHSANAIFQRHAQGRGTRVFSAAPTHAGGCLEDDFAWILCRLRAAAFDQIIGVDLTKPEFGIPVVRVVVPGLETICGAPGYVPGRRAGAVLAERARRDA